MDINKLKSDYNKELQNYNPLSYHFKENLSSFEAYVNWRKRTDDLFDQWDKARLYV